MDADELNNASRQMLAIEELLGGTDFMPVEDDRLPQAQDTPPSAKEPAYAAPAADIDGTSMTRDEKASALQTLATRTVSGCTRCALSQTRTQTVFGEGSPDADLVFVGEGPGAEEDRTGRPFVGRAGELLTKMITAMGLSRDDVFICNMVKCRPPGNRNPAPEEVQTCWNYLVRQLQIIRPTVIVTLGNPATKGLLNTTTGITRLRGSWQKLPEIGPGLGDTPVMPTFHPAYVLRQYTSENRGKVWSDLQAVMQKLGLSVPTKKS
ncbi:MAG: uracil-DNA glycosylase [Phycisphaerae bacterium]|jgi:DNA polymerase|nr:uracil-DNA glycosylase [Phycisphaerae bacterium]